MFVLIIATASTKVFSPLWNYFCLLVVHKLSEKERESLTKKGVPSEVELETKFVFRLFLCEEIPRGQGWGKEEKTNAESSSRGSLTTRSWICLELLRAYATLRIHLLMISGKASGSTHSSRFLRIPSGMLAPPHNRKQKACEFWAWDTVTWTLHRTTHRDPSWRPKWSREGVRQSSSPTGQRDCECYFYSADIMKHLEIYFRT